MCGERRAIHRTAFASAGKILALSQLQRSRIERTGTDPVWRKPVDDRVLPLRLTMVRQSGHRRKRLVRCPLEQLAASCLEMLHGTAPFNCVLHFMDEPSLSHRRSARHTRAKRSSIAVQLRKTLLHHRSSASERSIHVAYRIPEGFLLPRPESIPRDRVMGSYEGVAERGCIRAAGVGWSTDSWPVRSRTDSPPVSAVERPSVRVTVSE